ncbi:MAG: aspartate--ammonia ligase [Mycoplasmatales bacterium]|nr:aspartate--ammonia ligase [Mycoplasmatales bacterium]
MYKTKIEKWETQLAIKKLEDFFKEEFSKRMAVTQVNGPLFVEPSTGLNDNLSGTETPVSFNYNDTNLEIVHSLAKWKRFALWEFQVPPGKGIFVHMDAIRPNENYLTKYHSLHVEQYDWEKTILRRNRNIDFLFKEVEKIYQSILETKRKMINLYPALSDNMAKEVTFISSEELRQLYPELTPEEREKEFAEINKAIFIYGIGYNLLDEKPHGLRAPDYDDWKINGDLIVWDEVNQDALELSSMGVRVDKEALNTQMKVSSIDVFTDFHKSVLNEVVPFSIGGGIGRSRINMFVLEKAHIGEVQTTYWPEKYRQEMLDQGIELLK